MLFPETPVSQLVNFVSTPDPAVSPDKKSRPLPRIVPVTFPLVVPSVKRPETDLAVCVKLSAIERDDARGKTCLHATSSTDPVPAQLETV